MKSLGFSLSHLLQITTAEMGQQGVVQSQLVEAEPSSAGEER
jgi:hypothetical protein